MDLKEIIKETEKLYDSVKAKTYTAEYWQRKADIDELGTILACLKEYEKNAPTVEPEQGEWNYGTVIQLEKPLTSEEKKRLHNMLNSNVPCFVDPEEQAIDKLYDTGWLVRHDQELVRGVIKRITDHGKVVVDNKSIASTIGKECYIMAHDHISAMLKKEWGIND